MIIREAKLADKGEIVSLYEKSQNATGLPNPSIIPPSELGDYLYQRHAINRYVATDDEVIVGHGLLEHPNPEHIADWQNVVGDDKELIELGGAFVDPSKFGRGVWSDLLSHRIHIVRSMGAVPVSVTWSSNLHVQKHFELNGGIEITQKETTAGSISLFIL